MSNKQVECFPITFTQEYSTNDVINLGNLPADARILSVDICSNNYNASSGDFVIGHAATLSYSADPSAFSYSLTGIYGPDVMVKIDGRGQKCDEILPITMKFTSNTADLTGSELFITIDYIQE
jgi:hypothetical protein